MSLTCRTYLFLDEQAARFERDAELAAKPADRMRLDGRRGRRQGEPVGVPARAEAATHT